jgi:Spy/CpxP family protein refolding chaperone
MKKMLLLLLIAVSTCALTFAQDSAASHKKRLPAKTSTAKQLNLTKDQQDKIKASRQDLKTKTAAIKGDKTLTDDQKKAQLKAAKKDSKAKVDKVYTPEQKAKLKQIKAQKKASSTQNKKTPAKTTPAAKS